MNQWIDLYGRYLLFYCGTRGVVALPMWLQYLVYACEMPAPPVCESHPKILVHTLRFFTSAYVIQYPQTGKAAGLDVS